MRSAQHLAVRLALFGTVLLAAGCYRPKILIGGFFCGDGGACPDGFVCDYNNGRVCVQTLSDGGAGKGGAGGQGGQGGKGGQAGRDAGVDRPCLGSVPSPACPTDAAVTGMCDPVCNTGCKCYEKCSVNTAGELTCNAPTSGTPVDVFGQCQQMSTGPTQTDNCRPGELCLMNGECGSRCYALCRTDSDCLNGASCSRDAGGGNKFCDSPPAQCNPVKGAAGNQQYSGCAGPPSTLSCYLASTGLTRTICDCGFAVGGRFGDDCVHSRDCFAGLACYDPTGGTAPSAKCYPVCRLPVDGGAAQPGEQGCNGGSSFCLPFSTGNPLYGYCING